MQTYLIIQQQVGQKSKNEKKRKKKTSLRSYRHKTKDNHRPKYNAVHIIFSHCPYRIGVRQMLPAKKINCALKYIYSFIYINVPSAHKIQPKASTFNRTTVFFKHNFIKHYFALSTPYHSRRTFTQINDYYSF